MNSKTAYQVFHSKIENDVHQLILLYMQQNPPCSRIAIRRADLCKFRIIIERFVIILCSDI